MEVYFFQPLLYIKAGTALSDPGEVTVADDFGIGIVEAVDYDWLIEFKKSYRSNKLQPNENKICSRVSTSPSLMPWWVSSCFLWRWFCQESSCQTQGESIMFPTIFSLALRDAGTKTKLASSLLIMTIAGGAVAPVIMGDIADTTGSMAIAFLIPLVCYGVIGTYALSKRHVPL